jgi:hypothetical protein
MLTTESQILSEITTHLKYAKFVPEKKQERNMGRASNSKQGNALKEISTIG